MTYSGRFTHGYPLAAGQVQASVSSEINQRSSIELHHQRRGRQSECLFTQTPAY